MIQFPESIADAYVRPARNISMPSAPGRTVRFLQGHAVLKDGRDMVAMLKRGDVKIVLTPYARGWMDTWFDKAGEVKAEVLMPEPARAVSWDSSLKDDILGPDGTQPDP
jgi:hypothetical protein